MPTNIAEYYTEELIGWTNTIHFYTEEMDQMEEKLAEIIRRNSIIDIAEKVEAQQIFLDEMSEKFSRLLFECKDQEALLKKNGTFIEDSLMDPKTGDSQSDLRRKMKEMEKEYIDVKFNCADFLLGTLKK
jgi:hypothetical protein